MKKKVSAGTIVKLAGAAMAAAAFLSIDGVIRFSSFLSQPPCWLTNAAHCVR